MFAKGCNKRNIYIVRPVVESVLYKEALKMDDRTRQEHYTLGSCLLATAWSGEKERSPKQIVNDAKILCQLMMQEHDKIGYETHFVKETPSIKEEYVSDSSEIDL